MLYVNRPLAWSRKATVTVFTSVSSVGCNSLAPITRLPWNLIMGTQWKSVEKIKISLKSWIIFGHITWRPKYALLLPDKLSEHKSALFECDGTGLLGQPRKHKHWANAPEYYFIRAMPILLLIANISHWHLQIIMPGYHECRITECRTDTGILL